MRENGNRRRSKAYRTIFWYDGKITVGSSNLIIRTIIKAWEWERNFCTNLDAIERFFSHRTKYWSNGLWNDPRFRENDFTAVHRGPFSCEEATIPLLHVLRSEGKRSSMKSLSLSPPLLLLLIFSNLFLIPSSSGENGLCISQGGRFPPFVIEGQKPRKAPKGPRDLTLCRVFRHNTCCDITQTYPASVSVRKLASTGEGSGECLQLWELLECSICDPTIGTRPGPPQICESFCDMVFNECSSAYFSLDMKTQILSPCGVNDIVCGRLSKWASNGTELCYLTGFSVQSDIIESDDVGTVQFCYGGKESLDSIANSWRSSGHGSASDAHNSSFWGLERVCWAIGGMVLTAGLIYISKRKSLHQRQRQAAAIRTAAQRRWVN